MYNDDYEHPRQTLAQMIAKMIERAEKEQGIPITCKLTRGLIVTITFEKRFYTLELKRNDVPPSRREWNIVHRSWPYPTYTQCLADKLNENILHGHVGLNKQPPLLELARGDALSGE